MQLFKKGQADAAGTTPASTAPKGKTRYWFEDNKRSIAAVALIVIAALFMRTVFAFAVSANSGWALSGGTTASEHLRNIVAMLTSGSFFGPDGWLFTSSNIHPPLVDIFLAGISWIVMSVSGLPAEQAASFTLGASSAIMGALACIPMYYLGKEVFDGKKRAGFLAALFLAFCPIVVANTVFSNGTTIAFTLFFVLWMLFFVVKGVKAIDSDHTLNFDFRMMMGTNNAAMTYALKAGIMFAVIAYSWNGFRSLAVLLIFTMVALMIVNRLTYRDVRPSVMFFSVILAIGLFLAAPYYIMCGLWSLVFSGVFTLGIIAMVLCISFALLQGKPWVVTIPAYIIATIALFVILAFAVPDAYNNIVNGNSVYAAAIRGVISTTGLTLSAVATYFGYFTVWCGAICLIYMVFKFTKNVKSNFFLVSFFSLLFGTIFAVRSTTLAVVYSPFFALGFAAFILWLFETIDFHEYFQSFRGTDIKTVWKKLFNPKPFIAIVCVLLLIAAPNMLTAVDASISNNEKSDWNEGASDIFNKTFVGSMGYTVYTDNEYKINYTLKQFQNDSDYENKNLLTWIDYSADVATYGHFRSVTDTLGNNAVPMAQILLSDETKGEATAAMIIYSMHVMGYEKSVDYLVDSLGLSTYGLTKERLMDVYKDPAAYRDYILKNTTDYGNVSSSISNENVVYLFLKKYLSQGIGAGHDIGSVMASTDENFKGLSTWKLGNIYVAIADESDSKIDYVMVTIGMLPIQYGDGSVFSAIASIAGYTIETTYGSAPQFYSVNSSTGAYTYTSAMYNTLLYKTIGGKTSAESAASTDASKFESVYGISNFTATYEKFYVKYNSNSDATVSSSGWEVKTYAEANRLKAEKGGVINYFGYPMVIKFALPGDSINGTVSDSSGNAIENARAELWDSTGNKVAMAYTDKDGYYEMPLKTDASNASNTVLRIYAGAAKTETTGGALIDSVTGVKAGGKYVCTASQVTFSGYVDFADENLSKKFAANGPDNVKVELTGTNYKKVYTLTGTWDSGNHRVVFSTDASTSLVFDTYSIKVTTADGTSLGTGTYTVENGDNKDFRIAGTICTDTITVKDASGIPVSGAKVTLTAVNNESLVYNLGVTDYQGKTASDIYIVPGKYNVAVNYKDKVYESQVTVTSATSTNSVTITEMKTVTIQCPMAPNLAQTLLVTNGIENYTAKRVNETTYTVDIPVSSIAGQASSYVVYHYDATTGKVYYANLSSAHADVVLVEKDAKLVTGKLLSKSGDNDAKASAGTVYFVLGDGTYEDCDAMIAVTAQKLEGSEDYTYTFYAPDLGQQAIPVYATDGSSYVAFTDTSDVNATNGKDITMKEGYKVSGKFYWGSSNYFMHVNLSVSGCDVLNDLPIFTDSSGSFSFVVPKDANTDNAKLIANVSDPYYFSYNETEKTYKYDSEHKFNSSTKTFSFQAHTNNVKLIPQESMYGTEAHNYVIYNNTDYDIEINGKVIKSKEYMGFDSELAHSYFTVKLNYVEYSYVTDSVAYVYADNVIVKINVTKESTNCPVYIIGASDIASALADTSNWYTKITVNYNKENAETADSVKPTVTITNIRSDEIVDGTKPFSSLVIKSGTDVTDGTGVKYVEKYVKWNSNNTVATKAEDAFLTNPYFVKITRTVDDVDYIYYATLLGNEGNVDIDAIKVLRTAMTYSGSVGPDYSGVIRFQHTADDGKITRFTTTVSSGTYSIVLPASKTDSLMVYNTDVVVSTTADGFKYTYKNEEGETLTVDTVPITEEKKYDFTKNFTVTLKDVKPANADPSLTLAIETDGMTHVDPHKWNILFTVTLKNVANGTYKLSGGSAWNTLRFFTDADRTDEINTYTVTGSEEITLYCTGTITENYVTDEETGECTSTTTAAWGSPSLSVILSTIAGKEYVREYFGHDAEISDEWKSTDLPIRVGYGISKYSAEKRVFTVKFVNPNNFPVKYDMSVLTTGLSGYVFTVVCGYDIVKYEYGSSLTVTIPGASTTSVEVQVTTSGGSIGDLDQLRLQFKAQSDKIVMKEIGDSDITIAGTLVDAPVTIVTEKSIDVKDHSTKGRGVFDSLGESPWYLMVVGALILLAMIAMFWLGYRRGVFSRRK